MSRRRCAATKPKSCWPDLAATGLRRAAVARIFPGEGAHSPLLRSRHRLMSRQTPAAAKKLQRWMDIVTALLQRRKGAITFEQLRADVAAYTGDADPETVRRMFERDKEELRALGVPLIQAEVGDNDQIGYMLKAEQFFMPYITILQELHDSTTAQVDAPGYRTMLAGAFTDTELELLADAAARAQSIGDPLLSIEAQNAIGKFMLDVPSRSLARTPGETIIPPRSQAAPKTLAVLSAALHRRKHVTFTYFTIGRDDVSERVVHPYGLAYTSGHWYLHAAEPSTGELRMFRVSRISRAVENPTTPGTPDFTIPSSFALSAEPQPSWALGNDPVVDVVVEWRADNGNVRAARALGTPVPGEDRRSVFPVRRRDPFFRWLLGMAGDGVPVAPEAAVEEWQSFVHRTLASHQGGADGQHRS